MKPANVWGEKEWKWAQETYESACHICSYWTEKRVVFLIADVQPAFAEWLKKPRKLSVKEQSVRRGCIVGSV